MTNVQAERAMARNESTAAGSLPKSKGSHAPRPRKERFTISLSQKSADAFKELKELTDADTDSEVFRNALRLHLSLLRAHVDGKKILVQDDNTNVTVPVDLFVPVE